MKNNFFFLVFIFFSWFGFSSSIVQAQMQNLHGDEREYRIGMHSGNQFRTTFFNDGTWGGNTGNTAGMSIVNIQIPGEWPINSGHWYCIDGCTFILSEVAENYDPSTQTFLTSPGTVRHIQSTVKAAPGGGTVGDKDPNTQAWWTFLPLAGFANSNDKLIAMAKGDRQWWNDQMGIGSWPMYWPDIKDPQNPYKIYSPDGWAGSWNGYFGRDKFNADEESYFVADDYAKQKFPAFRPDTTDVQRGGLGIRMYVRGFQWAKIAVQDALFIVSDLENIGTYQHNKVVFGYKIGNNMGQTNGGADAGDDGGSFSVQDYLCWTWDLDGRGPSDFGPAPVGIAGAALLETPGNPFDGIDNDNDANPASPNYGMKNKVEGAVTLSTIDGPKTFYAGSGPIITSTMFNSRVIGLDDRIVLIDYKDRMYRRAVTTLRDTLTSLGKSTTDTLGVPFGGFVYKFWVGDTLNEIGDNLFDDNLNGIIDENRGEANPKTGVMTYLYLGHKYIDYAITDKTTNGVLNPLIDERRDDGIDNDGNWEVAKDDVGQDGLGPADLEYRGPDVGEGDGKPTPGETHFDKTDINESDLVGLTSFNLYQWNVAEPLFGTTGKQDDDEGFWNILKPGSFYAYPSAANVELLFGSGYFPLPPKNLERISYAFIVVSGPSGGWTTGAGEVTPPDNLLLEKTTVQLAYNQNYNFAKAPLIPTVTTVTGDKRVTLFWDDLAESSFDPISSYDFEGYKIYRSTDPGWNDMAPITDGHGSVVMREPLAQYDLENGFSGYATEAKDTGVRFWLGKNTGLRHFFIDTTVTNGTTYYYAVTSYDHGDVIRGIDPTECTKYIAVQSSGKVERGKNVVVVRPEAPSAGYVPGKVTKVTALPGSTSTGIVDYNILNNSKIKNNHTYQVTFSDTVTGSGINLARSTKDFTLTDITVIDTPIILLKNSSLEGDLGGPPVKDGFQLTFSGNPAKLSFDSANSGWSKSGIPIITAKPFSPLNETVRLIVGDFQIVFSDTGFGRSKPFHRGAEKYPAQSVNFKVYNITTNSEVSFAIRKRVQVAGRFAFKYDPSADKQKTDEIIFLTDGDTVASWRVIFYLPMANAADTILPGPVDVLTLRLNKPFLSNDTLQFTTISASVNNEIAKADLGRVKVVPNPYIITNSWEPHNPYSTGRGERQLHFTHLPAKCTIKIFNVKGQLVNTIEHDNPLNDGTAIWNMLSKDNLEISYGIYIFHIEAEGVGEKIGKFVVLK